MIRILKGHGKQVALSVIAAIIGVALEVLPFFAVSQIVTLMMGGNHYFPDYIIPLSNVFVGLIGKNIFHQISTLTSHKLAFNIIADIRIKVGQKLERLSMGENQRKSSGEWVSFMDEGIHKIELPIAHVIPEVISNLLIPFVLLIIIFTIDFRIGIANIITIPIAFIFLVITTKDYGKKYQDRLNAQNNMSSIIVEYIKGIKVIKAFNKSASSYDKYKKVVEDYRKTQLKWFTSSCLSATAMIEVLPSTLLFVLPLSMYIYMIGEIGISEVVMCTLLSYASFRPLLKVMTHFDNTATIKYVVKEIDKIMETSELERTVDDSNICGFDIDFENVGFSYDRDNLLFENLSFSAKERSITAFVGMSGSGKSTIAKLISGFWNVDKGAIKIGGKNLGNISLEENMALVSYVSQDNFLFKISIVDNLKMAKENASMEEIIAACKKASVHEFIERLPRGYNTIVGESGASLSGGERQRITIARAILKDSPIIVLDEATAYSDPDNEAIIQNSINELVKDKTVIMIAHRLSTIINADKIIVLDKGEIKGFGTHLELLENNNTYKNMWHSHISVSKA